ncbi:hypothetical protein SLE2022_098950 [Rubroshorea leprosula]
MEGLTGSGRKMQKLQSSPAPKPQSISDVPMFSGSQMGGPMNPFSRNLSHENNSKRPGIPPSHPNNSGSMPYSQIMGSRSNSQQLDSQNLKQGPGHSRSLSQPTFFSLDCLPPLSPSPYWEPSVSSLSDPTSTDVSMEEKVVNSRGKPLPSPVARGSNEFRAGESLPPLRGHRRSSSDIPLGFSAMIHSSPQLIPIGTRGALDRSVSGRENLGVEKPIQLVKKESESSKDGNSNADGFGEKRSEGEVDDFFSAYMNLDNIDTLNSSGTEDKDLDSRASGAKTNGCESSDNEVESRVNGYPINMQGTSISTERREGVKRSAPGDIAQTSRHYRSVSMDSYMGGLQFDDDSLKVPLQNQMVQGSPGDSMDANLTESNFVLGNDGFSASEMKKIMENEKLAEMLSVDPKRVKRILANRQSAARSKERKMRYIAELEHKVQTLQTEATTLSAQLTVLQRDSAGLTTENNELKFRLQAMEQQAQLKDALNEALAAELQRLKLAASELGGEVQLSNHMLQQLSLSNQMFRFQPQQLNAYQTQQPEHQQPLQQAQSQQPAPNNQSETKKQNGEPSANESK